MRAGWAAGRDDSSKDTRKCRNPLDSRYRSRVVRFCLPAVERERSAIDDVQPAVVVTESCHRQRNRVGPGTRAEYNFSACPVWSAGKPVRRPANAWPTRASCWTAQPMASRTSIA